MDCPSIETIYSYLLEDITGEEKKIIQKHIEECHICQTRSIEIEEDIYKIKTFLKNYNWENFKNNSSDRGSELNLKEREDIKDINKFSSCPERSLTWNLLKCQIMSIYFLLWKKMFFQYKMRRKFIPAFTAIIIVLFIPLIYLYTFSPEHKLSKKFLNIKYEIKSKIYPDDPVTAYNLGLIRREDNPEEAKKLIEKACLLNNNYTVSYYNPGNGSIPKLKKIIILSDSSRDYISQGLSFSVRDKLSLIKTLNPLYGELWDEMNRKKSMEEACNIAAGLGGNYLLYLNNLSLKDNRWHLNYSLIEIIGKKVIGSGILVSPSIVQIQIKLALEVARILTGNLTEMEENILKDLPCNPRSFELYLEGKGHYYRYVEEDNRRAIELFREVIRLEPDFAPAYAGLADSLTQQYGLFNERKESLIRQSVEYAKKALDIDPSLAEAYKSLGLSFTYQGKKEEGIKEYEKALMLNENYTEVYINLGMIFLNEKDFNKAFTMLEKAIKTNPYSSEAHKEMANYYLRKRDYKKAIKSYELAIDAGFLNRHSLFQSYSNIALCYKLEGEYEKAIFFLEKALSVDSDKGITSFELGEIFNITGNREKAIKYYKDYLNMEDKGKFSNRVKITLKLLESNTGKAEGLLSGNQGETTAGLKIIYTSSDSKTFIAITDRRGFYSVILPEGIYKYSEVRRNKEALLLKNPGEIRIVPGQIKNLNLYLGTPI